MLEALKKYKIVAIFRKIPPDKISRAAKALYNGGIRFMEITMNSEDFQSAIRVLKDELPDDAYIGAGTVLNIEMAKKAIAAGAAYIVSPNTDIEMIRYCVANNIPVFPGAMTPSEIVAAWNAGCTAVKLFPMGSLGLSYLKDIRAPLDNIPLLVTGGVNLDNICDFIRAGADCFGLGGNLVKKDLIEQDKYQDLFELAVRFVNAIQTI